jgi:uncharacterized membrane protein YphA (DoxX/SURF4 family)
MNLERPSGPYATGHFLLRVGIAAAFLYPPISALSDPIAWSGYFPAFIQGLPIDSSLLLHAFGAVEVLIALWLIWGRHLRIPAVLATLMLLAIVVFNLNDFSILFRDVSLALAALALAFLPEPGSSITPYDQDA